jgi:hypothetical protein
MKKRVVLSCLISAVTLVQAQTIWKIGEKDNSAAEFALAPDNYADFLKEDFGWEDKFYIGRRICEVAGGISTIPCNLANPVFYDVAVRRGVECRM